MDECGRWVVRTLLGFKDVPGGRLLPFKVRDLPACLVELPGQPLLEGVQFGEALGGRQVGHVFDSRGARGVCHPGGVTNPDRYHLTLTAGGRPVQQGWWGSEATARRKWSGWIGEYSNLPDARIVLVDEDTGETLASWPGPVVGGGS